MKKKKMNVDGKSITKENRNCCTERKNQKATTKTGNTIHTLIFYGMEKLLID